MAQLVENLPAMPEIGSLGLEEPLEEETATRSSTLAWEIPRSEEPGGLQSSGPQRVRHDRATEHRALVRTSPFQWSKALVNCPHCQGLNTHGWGLLCGREHPNLWQNEWAVSP